uniref:WD repeat domain 59 n=1 Tax=Fundulus heteroclitus TaxID=8078 RepID=A0A3Q2U674_FUNHE
MAARWSSENVVVEFRDAQFQATAMSVDCLGAHAVSRRFLYMVNLEAPSEAPRKIGRHSKWDVGTVQWNRHRSEAHVFAASQSNQRVDLYSWRDGCGEAHSSLQGHTRVIDLDWSWFDPEFLVTSSVDTYIYIWDTDTRKPTVALSAVGAAQVKWNRRNQHLLASSHDGDVRIWDKRQKPNTAVEYLAAHLSKIHGLDWHPDNEFIFATSSQDNSVRFWDYRQPRKYLNILSCQVPVWKARYTPFSNGLVTVMVPQLRRENSLLLWSTLDLNSPVHAFVGHDDVVLEFQWRPQKESKDFQLVTWSRDQTLRIWRVDPQLQKLCVSDTVEELMEGMSLAVESEKSPTSQEAEGQQSTGRAADSLLSGLAQTLQQEFSLVNLQIRNVNVEMDAMNRSCVVSAHFGSHQVHLVVKFPVQYPNNAAPSFQFVSPTTIPSAMKIKIQKILTDTSLQKVKRNQNCLEPCVRQLVSCLESDTQEDSPSSGPFVLSNPVTPSLQAFPRVSNTYGSCLVYFTRPITMHRSAPPTEPTPSLSALSAYHSGVLTPMKMRSESQNTLRLYSGSPTRSDKDTVSISSFYYKERKLPMSASRRWSVQTLHDWPLNMNDIQETCQKNTAAALVVGRRDLAKQKSRRFKTKREGVDCSSRPIKLAGKVIIQEISCLLPVHKALGESYVWALASAATSQDLSPDSDPDTETPWARHPFGRQLLETLDHYSQMSDVQTLAVLCSVFRAQAPPLDCYSVYGPPSSRLHSRYSQPSYTSSSVNSGSCSSTSDSITPSTWNAPEHPNPWGESSPDDYRYASQGYTDPRERERELHDMNKLLDPANTLQYDDFKKCYGEILYRWGLGDKRADVLKFTSSPPEPHKGVFGVYCCHCRSQARGTQCAVCKRLTFQCAVCHVAVRGSSNFCLSCGHGGHTGHMMDWFRRQDECPAGCGCHCLLQSTF